MDRGGCCTIPAERLHALTLPPEGAAELSDFEAVLLKAGLPLACVSEYVAEIMSDPKCPVDLRRLRPDSQAWRKRPARSCGALWSRSRQRLSCR